MNRVFAALVFGPILLWILCIAAVMILSGPFGCTIHEGFANPCLVWGTDQSENAYTFGMLGAWGPLFFGPLVMGVAMLWGIFALIRRARR
ncbi:hypothetical protein P775_20945 [Puniceibacterium antarcticum]|uniref:Uncharacterized protein n=1 Tax=Puniceibacterium antarcticum TaxID=1206336 RepID=A0A2G8R9I7_9RHOB|nr:hypothetical protein [Puniceibacterium antarcticum]PIL18226.1 hypothetical protein P775_20945 [Puniceibacterium antarcticum]